jgi:PAS domain S-box-containing protein
MSTSRTHSREIITVDQLQTENSELRRRLAEIEETIQAIQDGAVDALVVGQAAGQRIYTLDGADRPYRLFVEGMQQGAATLYADGTVAYCNQQLADLLKVPQSRAIGLSLRDFISTESRPVYDDLLRKGQTGSFSGEVFFKRSDESSVPVFLAFNALPVDTGAAIGLLITDLTTEKYHQELAAAHEALRKSENALSRKERQLLHITENTSVIIAQCSSDCRYVFANRACAAFLGRPVEEIVGKPLAEIMGEEAFDAIRPYIERVLKGERVEYEAEVPYARLGVRHMRVSYVPDFDVAGDVCGWIASITDITDRKRTEEALRDSEARLSTFLEQLPIGVGAFDLDGRWTIRNAVMRSFAGTSIPSQDSEGISRWQAFDAAGQPISSQAWPGVRALRGETVSPGMEMTYTTDAGTQIWTRVSAAPLFNQSGKMIGALSVVQDIDAVKRAELAVRDAADRFRSLVSVITDVPWTADPTGAFTTLQPAWAWYTGQQWEDYRGFGWVDALHPDDREDLRKSWLQACASKSAYVSANGRLWHEPTRQYRFFEAQATPVFNPDGTVREWVGAYTDINARRQLEQQLEERAVELARALEERKKLDEEREQLLESERYARTEAERSTRLKEEFLSTVSHELRTPLNAILGWTQLMQQSSDEQTWKQGLDAIERGARGQALLIDELLDVSRIVSGKLRIEVEVLEVAPLVEAAVETLRPAAEAKSIQLLSKLSWDTRPIKGDPARIQQTVWNLLSNAIKFTPKGGTVQVHVTSVEGFIDITVTDTGAGISEKFLPFVFDRFRQADNTTTRAHGGLGLGLAIVKHLVELHGGTVSVESEGEGKGAMFTVRLPVATSTSRQADSTPPDLSPKRLTNVKVLVVDDDINSSEIVRRILVGREATVSLASSADEALAMMEQFEPDVLISDIGMPGKDGLTLIREIRLQENRMRSRRLPAVALTAFARPEDRIRVLQAGYNTHVAKPVDPRELIAVVGSLTGQEDRQ